MGLLSGAAAVAGVVTGASASKKANRLAKEQFHYEQETNAKNYDRAVVESDRNFAEEQKWNQLNFDAQQAAFEKNYQAEAMNNERNFNLQKDIFEKNYALDVQNQEYMKEMQREAWMREDTATSRRAADLKAAGINPLLAAGGAASSSGPVRIDAPHMEVPHMDTALRTPAQGKAAHKEIVQEKIADNANMIQALAFKQQMVGNALSLMREVSDISRTNAEADLIRSQKKKSDIDYKFIDDTYQERLNMLMQDYSKQGVELRNKELEQELLQRKISQADVDLIYADLRNKSETANLTEQQLRNLSLDLAIQEDKRNRDIYKGLGLPSNAGFDPTTRMGQIIWNGLKESLKRLK